MMSSNDFLDETGGGDSELKLNYNHVKIKLNSLKKDQILTKSIGCLVLR